MAISAVSSVSSGGASSACLYRLNGAHGSLGDVLASSKESVAPAGLGKDPVFEACISHFSHATHVLVEYDYFDLDSRSNAKATVDLRHKPMMPAADRLVFFVEPEDSPGDPEGLTATVAFLSEAAATGYMVLLPDPTGPVGRSIIPPPLRLPGVPKDVDLSRQVRTVVSEVITVLGKPQKVSGTTFMQQDGHLLTCSHVAAWMVHFAAVLRGLVARHPSIDFHTEPTNGMVRGRAFPSPGLTSPQIATALGHFGLPTVDQTVIELDVGGRLAEWYDREVIWELSRRLVTFTGLTSASYEEHLLAIERELDEYDDYVEQITDRPLTELRPAVDDVARIDEAENLYADVGRFWIRESLTRTVCQHLNSGFPAILLRDGHAKVLTGYLRRHEVAVPDEGPAASTVHPSDTDVVAFIASDDQESPYSIVWVDELLDDMEELPLSNHVLFPLPRGIWVSASEAEDLGAKVFQGGVERCLASLRGGSGTGETTDESVNADATAGDDDVEAPTPCKLHVDGDAVAQVDAELASVLDEISRDSGGERDLSLRSYVTPSTDFKRSFATRCSDQIVVNQVTVANLPKYVWVVEVIRRSERHQHHACVVGEVVLDATDTDLREANAYVVHLPGSVRVRGRKQGGRWHITGTLGLYESGRYHGKREVDSDEALVSRFTKALA